jgi:hypothetical protein
MPGALSQNAFSQALTFAQVATSTVLDGQGRAGAGEVAAGLDDARVSHFEVHQAQGMVMVQLGVSLAEALARMRAYAFANEQRLADVAGRIVRRELVLPRDHDRRPDARGEGSQR